MSTTHKMFEVIEVECGGLVNCGVLNPKFGIRNNDREKVIL